MPRPTEAHARIRAHLESVHGARIVNISGNLFEPHGASRRAAGIEADVYLVELKAAAIDVVAEAALARGAEVVLAANDLVPLPGEQKLDELLLGMAKFGS